MATTIHPGAAAEPRSIRIESEDLARKVYKVLKGMIIDGELRSGEKLVQEDLADRLGVSRTPLLFAISKLEQENLVETLPRRGAYVRRYGHKDLIDIYEIRCRLEPLAARDAATNMTDAEIAGFAERVDAFDAAVRTGDPQALKRTDYDLHMELLRCCGNQFLYDMLAAFNIVIISNTKGLMKPAEKSSREHHGLLAALRARDPARAEAAMFDHVNESRLNLIASDAYLLDRVQS